MIPTSNHTVRYTCQTGQALGSGAEDLLLGLVLRWALQQFPHITVLSGTSILGLHLIMLKGFPLALRCV